MNMKFIQIILAALLAAYMGLVRRTTRWEIDGDKNLTPLQESQKGVYRLRLALTVFNDHGWVVKNETTPPCVNFQVPRRQSRCLHI